MSNFKIGDRVRFDHYAYQTDYGTIVEPCGDETKPYPIS